MPVGLAFQIAFNAVCISPKTPEAVTNRVTIPTIVATIPDGLQDLGSLLAHQTAQLGRDRVLCGILTERKSRDGNHDEQNRRDGCHSVEGDCSTTAQRFIVYERQDGLFQHLPNLGEHLNLTKHF